MLFYSLTIFLSAFLLFEVQPVIAKMILPWFGGSSAVWSTCMLFFQVVLLLVYLYAHLLNNLALLGITVGLPYFLLSSTSPLLQAWYARTHSGGIPYRLFALSNLASMLALLTYPFLVEPNLTSHAQAIAWSAGFAGFVAICALTAWRSAAGKSVASPESAE